MTPSQFCKLHNYQIPCMECQNDMKPTHLVTTRGGSQFPVYHDPQHNEAAFRIVETGSQLKWVYASAIKSLMPLSESVEAKQEPKDFCIHRPLGPMCKDCKETRFTGPRTATECRGEALNWKQAMKAFAEGKSIQWYCDSKWHDINTAERVYFDSHNQYRLKPEPKERKTYYPIWDIDSMGVKFASIDTVKCSTPSALAYLEITYNELDLPTAVRLIPK